MPVYADVLIAVNGFVNYLLLDSARRMMKISYGKYRLFLAAAAGGLFSLIIFAPELQWFADFFMRIVMCAFIVFTAFGFGSIMGYIKKLAVFLSVNLIYGGLMNAVLWLIKPDGMIYKNGAVYFDIDFKVLALTSVCSFAVINLILKLAERKSPSKCIYNVEIISDGGKVKGRGLVDTGNSLREFFFFSPVTVGSYKAVKKIMPESIDLFLESGDADTLDKNIRLIPSYTVSGMTLLPAFRADEIRISRLSESYIHKNIYIAVSKTAFFGGEFEFLLNKDLTEETGYEKNTAENKAVH